MKRTFIALVLLSFTAHTFAQKTFSEPVSILPGHTDDLDALSVSPAGDFIATGSWDKMINIYSADSPFTMIRQLSGHSAPVIALRYNKSGRMLASSSSDYTIRLWDSLYRSSILEGHKANINCLLFDNQSRYLFSGSDDRSIIAWDIATGKPFRAINHNQPVNSLAMAGNDPRSLYVASLDPKIKVYNLANIQVARSFDGHSDAVNSIDISKNNLYLLSGSNDKTARLWDLKTGKELRKFPVECWKVLAVAFSDDSKYAVTGCNDGSVKVWEVETGKLISKMESIGNVVRDVAFLKNNTKVACANMLRGSKEYGLKIWPSGIIVNTLIPVAAGDSIKLKSTYPALRKADSLNTKPLRTDSVKTRGNTIPGKQDAIQEQKKAIPRYGK